MLATAASWLVVLAGVAAPQPLTITAPDSVASAEAARVVVRGRGVGLSADDVALTASAGSFGAIEAHPDGSASALFSAPRSATAVTVEIRASGRGPLAGASATAAVRVEAAPFPSSTTTSAGPLAIRAPDRVLLGGAERVELELAGGPRPDSVLLSAGGRGRLEARPGGWRMSYLLPPGRTPRVGIVAFADAAGRLLDWTALRLFGLADVTVDTEPRARVLLEIEGEIFGPVRADERGQARVSVAVPPGGGQAVARAYDDLGNVTQIPVDLAVPPFARVLVACVDDAAEVQVVAVGRDGEPAAARDVTLSPSVGTLSPLEPGPNGVWRSRLGVPADVAAGTEVTVAARAEGDPGAAACFLRIRPGLPAYVDLTLDRQSYVAGTGTPVRVAVSVFDADGRPTATGDVRLAAELGELTDAHVASEGVLRALWRPGDRFGERSVAVLRVRVGEGAAAVGAEAVLRLQPAQPERIELSSSADRVRADGHQTVELEVTPRDAYGNVVADAELALSADGQVGEPRYDVARRRFGATYRAPRRHDAGSDTIQARVLASGAVESLELRLDPSPLPLAASAKVGMARLGGLFAPMIQVDAGTRLPVIDDRLVASLTLAGTLRGTTEVAQGERLDSFLWAAPLAARLSFHWSHELIELSGGVLGGAALVGYRVHSPLVGRTSAVRLRPYAGVSGAASWGVLGGRMVVEATWARARIDDAALKADLLGIQLAAGYRIHL